MKYFIFLILTVRCFSAGIYYIDWVGGSDANNGTSSATPWKRCPGMPSFAGSYSHVAGDVFYFKGGVTWPSTAFPWVIANSGSAGNVDTYTTLNGFGTGQPILDGQATHPVGGMVHATSKQYFLINNMNIINQDAALAAPTANAEQMMVFDSCQHYTVQNCVLTPECKTCIYINQSSGSSGTYDDHNLLNNTVSHTGSLSWITTAGANFNLTNVRIKGNSLFDGYSQITHGIHCDGFVHFFSTPNHSANQTIGMEVSGNIFYGNWTPQDSGQGSGFSACIFTDSYIFGKIYNNAMSVTPQAAGQIPQWIAAGADPGMTVEIYNNTVDSENTGGTAYTGGTGAGSTLMVKNNIWHGGVASMSLDNSGGGTITCDYNLADAAVVLNGSFISYATWQSNGFDTHGLLGNAPTFVNVSANLRLQTGSVGLPPSGTNLSTIFTTDITGATRPSGTTAWTMGAYESSASGPTFTSSVFGKTVINGKTTIK